MLHGEGHGDSWHRYAGNNGSRSTTVAGIRHVDEDVAGGSGYDPDDTEGTETERGDSVCSRNLSANSTQAPEDIDSGTAEFEAELSEEEEAEEVISIEQVNPSRWGPQARQHIRSSTADVV